MGGVPDEATKLSKESQLSIRIEDDIEKICIKSFPEDEFADCMDAVKSGFIHVVDITNEFVNFSKETHMTVLELLLVSQAIKINELQLPEYSAIPPLPFIIPILFCESKTKCPVAGTTTLNHTSPPK